MTERTNNNLIKQYETENEDKLHKLLLTSTEEKQTNSRHELYKNPKKPEIQFRTESPSSLRSIASPLLVQNSVRNRLIENTKKRLRGKRGAENLRNHRRKGLQKGSQKGKMNSSIWPKAFSVTDASWFKRYQSLYKNMMKRQEMVSTYNEEPGKNNQYQNMIPNEAQRKATSDYYYYNYVYPLYHLHTLEGFDIPRGTQHYDNWSKHYETMPMRSRDVVPGEHLYQSAAKTRNDINKQPNGIVGLSALHNQYSTHDKQTNVFAVKTDLNKGNLQQHNQQQQYAKNHVMKLNHQQQQQQQPVQETRQLLGKMILNSPERTQEQNLHQIGLKDDASFMEAIPNYDNSMLTLHEMQSLIPKAQVKSIIPQEIKTPLITAKDSALMKNSITEAQTGSSLPVIGSIQLQSGTAWRNQNNIPDEKSFLLKRYKSYETEERNEQRSDIAPLQREGSPRDIALSFYKEIEKPRIDFPPENIDEKRDVIYKDVGPLSDIDSDDVTAENLAAIFNELDDQVDAELHEAVAKKDTVSRPEEDLTKSQNEIEMTVYDTTKNMPIKKSGLNLVKVTNENGAEMNFEQGFDIRPLKNEKVIGTLKNTIIRPRFNLKRLHFGLKNGNMLE